MSLAGVYFVVVVLLLVAAAGGVYMMSRSRPSSMPPVPSVSPKEIELAALRLVRQRVPYPSYPGGTFGDVANAEATLAGLRREFENYEPPEMRKAVLGWLDFFDNQLAQTKEDLLTQKSKREQDAYHKEQEAVSRRADELLQKLRDR